MTRKYTPRIEDYLTTIYRIKEAFGTARISDISRELGVREATVSKVIDKLEKQDYVFREKYHYVELTPKGREIAERIIRKHRIAEYFLSKILNFNDKETHIYAHYLEHLPDVVIERLHAYLGYPQTCPHGNPLPGNPLPGETIKLTNAPEGLVCVVKRLIGELKILLDFIEKHSIGVGDKIIVLSSTPESLRVRVNNNVVEIPRNIARLIEVECN